MSPRLAPQALAVLAGLLAAMASPAWGGDWQAWERYMESGQRALEQGREVGAENWFLDAVQEAERRDARGPQLVRSLKRLLELYRRQGRQRDVAAIEQRLVNLTGVSAPADGGGDVVATLEKYVALLRELGRERDASVVGRRVERLRALQVHGGGGELLFFNPAAELQSYARLLRQRDRETEALTVELLAAAETRKMVDRYARVRKVLAAEASLDPALTWVKQMNAADEAMDGQLYPEAEGLLRDAVRTAETFLTSDARLAYTLGTLAIVDRAQGKSNDFAAANQRAMALLEKAAGTGERLIPRSLTLLTMAHLRFGFEPEATLAHARRALPILEKSVARDHPVVGLQLAALAAAYVARGQAEQAKPYLARALAIADQQYLPEHVALAIGLMTVVDVYSDQGDYARASAVAERVVAILGKMLDPAHPDVVAAAEQYRALKRRPRPATVTSLSSTTTVPLRVEGKAMLVYATVNRAQRALLLVDSGATSTILRPLVLARLGVTIPADAPRRRLILAGGRTLVVPLVTVALQVGDATVEHLEVGVSDVLPGDPELDGFLGADFLQQFKVTLEKAARRMTLEPLRR